MSDCTKRQYTASTAQITLDRLVQRWKDGTLQDPCYARRAYLCPSCGHYHLTKQDARRFNPTDVFPTGTVPTKSTTVRNSDDGYDALRDLGRLPRRFRR